MKTLAKRLREARKKSGYNQIDAAKKLGISNGTLSGYERNYRDPDTDTLKRMADLYDVSVDWLLGKSDPNSERETIIHKIATEFPEADLMFKDMESLSIEQLQEVYEFIKFKKGQKEWCDWECVLFVKKI